MKTSRLLMSLLVLGFLLVAVPAMAAQVTLVSSPYSAPYLNLGNGGEFTWQPSTDLSWILNNYDAKTKNVTTAGTFESFCIEMGEHISWGGTYDVTFSNKAMYGGIAQEGDPISIGTAWLFSQFATGVLADYDYTGARTASAGELQKAFWYLEGEITVAALGNNIFYNAALAQFDHDDAEARANAAPNAYGVAVMNLGAAGQAQDQLVMVPEPSTLLLLGVCLVGVAIAVRTFKVRA